jgi:hypothetical protein
MVCVHQIRQQFCWSGVTGMTIALSGGVGVMPRKWSTASRSARSRRCHFQLDVRFRFKVNFVEGQHSRSRSTLPVRW